MTELKAGVLVTPHNEGMSFYRGSDVIGVTENETEFYLKSEADKVIQRLDNAVDVYKSSLKISKGLEAELSAKLCESKKTCKAMRRALWLARAERAADRARIFYFNDLKTILDIDGYSYDSKKKKGHKKTDC